MLTSPSLGACAACFVRSFEGLSIGCSSVLVASATGCCLLLRRGRGSILRRR